MNPLDFCCGLVACALFVLCWAATGHGLWKLAGFIWKGVFQQTHHRYDFRTCPHCHRPGAVANGRCMLCGLGEPPHQFIREPRQEEVVARYLDRCFERGQISDDEHRHLQSLLLSQIVQLEPLEPLVAEVAHAAAPVISLPQIAQVPPTPCVMTLLVENAATACPPVPPARSFSEMLQAFFEERNIRWGEILAGLFIVVSAIGLIISLRNTLRAIPYFPALMFMLFTVLFHGAGLYSLRKWNLRAVSRVVLIISLLLVPLSFGAGIVLSGAGEARRPLSDPYVLTAIVVGIAVFSWVTWSAAQELVGRSAWQLNVAVMGTAVGQIVISRWPIPSDSGWPLMTLAAIPLLSYFVALGPAIANALPVRQIVRRRSFELLLTAGVSLFALSVPLALLIVNATNKRIALADLSPLLSLVTGCILAVGLLLRQKITSKSLAIERTAGTSVAFLATLWMLGLLLLAWPQPALLTTVGILDGVVLLTLAVLLELPLLHAGGVAALTLAYLVGFQWLRGAVSIESEFSSRTLATSLLQVSSVVALTLWNVALLGSAVLLRRALRQRRVARVYLASAGGVAIIALMLAAHAGFAPWMPRTSWSTVITVIFAVYSAILLACARRIPITWLTVAAAGVWWLAITHLLAFTPQAQEWLAGVSVWLPIVRFPTLIHAMTTAGVACLLAHGTLGAGDCEFERRRGLRGWRVLVRPLGMIAFASSLVALALTLLPWSPRYFEHAWSLATIAATWLLLTLLSRQAWGLVATQLALHAAMSMAIAARWQETFVDAGSYWQASHVLEQIAGQTALVILWPWLRLVTERFQAVHRRLSLRGVTFDAVLLPVGAIALFGVASAGVAPLVGAELGWTLNKPYLPPRSWEQLAFHPLAWTTILLLASGFVVRMWEKLDVNSLAGMAIVLTAIPVVAASAWAGEVAAASALRWGYMLLLCVTTLLFLARGEVMKLVKHLPQLQTAHLSWGQAEQLRYFLLAVAGVPILILTCLAVVFALAGHEPVGPVTGTFFARMGQNVSYGLPLLALVASLVAYGVQERQSRFMLAAAALFQFAVNLALLLYLKDSHLPYARQAAVIALQVNALGSGLFSLLWLALDRWMKADAEQRARIPRLVDLPIAYLTRLVVLIAIWAAVATIASPTTVAPWDRDLASWLSFAALALNMVVVCWRYNWKLQRYCVEGIVLLLAALAALVAVATDHMISSPLGRGYLALETSWLVTGLFVTVWAWLMYRSRRVESDSVPATSLDQILVWRGAVLTLMAGALAVYASWNVVLIPWYCLVLLTVVQMALLAQGLLTRNQAIPYAALLFALAAGAVAWWNYGAATDFSGALRFVHLLCFTGVGVTAVWLAVEIVFQRRQNTSFDLSRRLWPMHRVAMWLLTVSTLLTTALIWFVMPLGLSYSEVFILRTETAACVLLVGILLLTSLWDRDSRVVLPLYLWGAAATSFVIVVIFPEAIDLPLPWAKVALLVALAGCVAITSLLWKWGADLASVGLRLGIADPVAGLVRTSHWLPKVNGFASCVLGSAAVVAVLTLPVREMRFLAAITPLLLGWSATSLAQKHRRETLLTVACVWGMLAAACLGWADLGPQHSAEVWLDRTIRLLMALSLATVMYGLVVPRWMFTFGDWHVAARRTAGIAGAAALATLVVVLGQEFVLFEPSIGAPLTTTQVTAISMVLVGLVVGFFSLALLRGIDPFGLFEEQRIYYVYAAEVAASLLFTHLYLARPGLFDGTLRPYWPYIIVGLAFAGVGLGEMFRRRGLRVLAEPLERTGGLLPLLPALGMWFLASQSDYAVVLFVIGLIYLIHSWLRQSFTTGLAAAVAGNGALWVWLSREEDLSLLVHPQLWLIPPALSVLLASHLERRRLDPAALTAIRYAAMLVLHLSSTSEMFIVGLGESLWPPVILALLALAGVFSGMLLQIRAFLYLGTGFVLLALVSMISHAAQAIDHVWPWWAFGIGVGLAILALFGLFEKKRAELMEIMERLRQWES